MSDAPPDTLARTADWRDPSTEVLGIVEFANVAPLHFGLEEGPGTRFVRGVPTTLNEALRRGEIDLTLVSSVEFVRHRAQYRALPDFSIATLGPVYSVMLFHLSPWDELGGARVAVTPQSATSVELLRSLLTASGMEADLLPTPGTLDEMLATSDAALLIGDAALTEAVRHLRPRAEGPAGRGASGLSVLNPRLHVTDLGEAWYRLTRLPFTFAVWASRADRRPSDELLASFRAARTYGLGRLAEVAEEESRRLGLSEGIVQRYLENFRYYLEPPDLDGLEEFALRVDPSFRRGELRFWDD